jgi:YegS/Rv2252/BmrU family lipid kinase
VRIRVLANPAAGGGVVARRLSAVVDELERRFSVPDVEVAESWDDLRRRAARAARAGVDVVAAVGGDGTVSAVANGLAGTPTALAVVPLGTGSDFFRGYAGRADWQSLLAQGHRRRVDVGEIVASGTRRLFVNMLSAGFGADVVHGRLPLPGPLAYGVPAFLKALRIREAQLGLTVDGETLEGAFVAVFVAKGRFAGGGIRLGAHARLDDGKFSVVAVRATSPLGALRRLPSAMRGRLDDPLFLLRAASRVTVVAHPTWRIEADGELLGETPVETRIWPAALTLLAPTDESRV